MSRSPHQSVTGARTSASSKPHGRPRYASSRASHRPPSGTTRRGPGRTPRRSPDRPSAAPGAAPRSSCARRAAATRASRIARLHIARQLARRVGRRHRPHERDARHAIRRDRGNRQRVRAACRPADDCEAVDRAAAATHLVRPRAERAAAHGRPAAIDASRRTPSEPQSNRPDGARAANRRRRAGRGPVRRPGRRRRRASAHDERRAHPELAVICDGAPERVSPGRELQRQSRRAPGRDDASPAMCRAPTRCTRRSCGSWPKLASSIIAGPASRARGKARTRTPCAHDLHARGGRACRCNAKRQPTRADREPH